MDASWSALSSADEETRRRAMEDRFAQLSVLNEGERLDTIEGMLRAEFSLSEEDLPAFTSDRLRAWIALEQRDPAQAAMAVRGYDTVIDRLPADMAMRRSSVVQGVARGMSADDVAVLHRLIPSLKLSVPVARTGATAERALVEAARERTAEKRARPFWKVWG